MRKDLFLFSALKVSATIFLLIFLILSLPGNLFSLDSQVYIENGSGINRCFFKTFWFYTVILTLIGILGITLFPKRLRKLQRKKNELEKIVKKRTAELNKVNRELKEMTIKDGLTKIANYRRFVEYYEREWKIAQRNSTTLAVIMIDIDYFKLFNDTYGHQAGDMCLIKVAGRLSKVTKRPGDLTARYGGEEFIKILPHTSRKGLITIAERCRKAVEDLKIIHEKSSVSDFVTISLGCAYIVPVLGENSRHLVNSADKALYQAKQSGRNKVVIAE